MKEYLLDGFKLFISEVRNRKNPDAELKPFIASFLQIPEAKITAYRIIQKSLDARSVRSMHFLYRLALNLDTKEIPDALTEFRNDEPYIQPENLSKISNPLVLGTGPAGLMAALILAEAGTKPFIFDRGFDVETREKDIDRLYQQRILNSESNFLFGEGGAGTYSDGKLYTRIRDPRIKYILDVFVKGGAAQEISYLKHPHIGSDVLPGMVVFIRKYIESLGGKFFWGRKAVGIIRENDKCRGLKFSDGTKVESETVILAPGHSAVELILSLINEGVGYSLKDFQIGSRIEHSQEFINQIRYGEEIPPYCLGAAEYNFVSRTAENSGISGAATFCMCPGGEIVPGSSVEGQLSTNGMSRFARNGKFANSAIIVNQKASDFKSAQDAFAFLAKIEKDVFAAGGSNYSSPAQDAAAFVRGEKKLSMKESSYKLGLVPASLDSILPSKTVKAIQTALQNFEKTSSGFMRKGKLVGVECKVSSPVRFTRDFETMESTLKGLYIAGEGAGFAGGITSAGVDGMKAAEAALGHKISKD